MDQARQQATQAADAAARAVSRGALFGSLGLLLGALAAWFGGRAGAVEPTLTARMGLGPINSGPLGGSRTTTVVSAEGSRTTSETRDRRV